MCFRFISAFLLVLLAVVYPPELCRGQSSDSILYLLHNDLLKNDAEKYDLLSRLIQDLSDADSILGYADQAIRLAQRLDVLPALPYLMKGEAYMNMGKLPLALESYITSAGYYENMGDLAGLGMAYNAMAETYNRQGNHDNEQGYLQRTIAIYEQEKDSGALSYALHNLAYFYYSMERYDSALFYYAVTAELFKQLDDSYAYAYCLGNSGLVYSRLSDFDRAERCLLQAIDTLAKMGDEPAIAEFTIEYASIFQEKGEIDKAITHASSVLQNTDDPVYIRDAAKLLAGLYEISGVFDSAYYYQSKFIVANDSIKNIESVQKMADLRTEYEVGRKQTEVDLLEKVKQRNRIINIGLGIILIMAIGLVTLYYTNLKSSKKLYMALEERGVLLEKQNVELKQLNVESNAQKEEIESQRDHLFIQNEAITDSINYAQRIQSALLPPEEYFHEILNDVFILFKPRDIVSGDFYWIKQVNQYVILAAADCTGHGVPGAFMSMLGISYLNEIVQRREVTQANQVLNELRKQVRNSLRQHGQPEESKDGMDMALCVIDEKNKVLQYSGANSPLYLIRDKNGSSELTEFKADRMPLGYYPGRFQTFTNCDIQLEFGDVFYMFSDGFVDQKGGEEARKFLSKNFKKLLLEIHQEPMREQKNILEQTLASWMGDIPQVDDILVIGMRV